MRNDTLYLQYIADSIRIIQNYLAGEAGGLDKQQFLNDLRTQDAVLRRLETLADAAGHLSEALKQRHASLPWRQIGDFRNVLAHGYQGVRLDLVWEVIDRDLAALQEVVAVELRNNT